MHKDNGPDAKPAAEARSCAGNGRRIYLIHGLMGTSYSHFAEQIKAWYSRYALVPLDLPGHGRSKLDAGRPYYACAVEYLRRAMEQKGSGHAVGLSYLGASVVVRCALTYPALFQSAVVSGYVPTVPHDVMVMRAAGFEALLNKQPSLQQQYESLHGTRWRQTLATVTTELCQSYASDVAVPPAMLSGLRVHTLILNGGIRSDERAAAIAAAESSDLVEVGVIPGAGHLVNNDEPDVYNAIVESFWQRVEADRHATDTL
jgi:pimeloyl-ACP methyl ester carboxylesterase